MKNASKYPLVSVIMPVYNEANHVAEAIESILNQSFKDFEFIIVNDGSTDQSLEIVRSFNDSRIICLTNEQNLGISKTLNRAIARAKGKYLVRMDADDISLPLRIETQVTFMEAHQEIGACGTDIQLFGTRNTLRKYGQEDRVLKTKLMFGLSLANPSIIFRKRDFLKLDYWYDPAMDFAEDYDLVERLSKRTALANISEVHLKYRIHKENSNLLHRDKVKELILKIRQRNIEFHLGRNFSVQEFNLFKKATQQKEGLNTRELLAFHRLLVEIRKAVKEPSYSKAAAQQTLTRYWLNCVKLLNFPKVIFLFAVLPPLRFHWWIPFRNFFRHY